MKLYLSLFSQRTELEQLAADRNLFLTGYATDWTVYNASGQCMGLGRSPVAAMSRAIFGAR
jgi:hypothetical protein